MRRKAISVLIYSLAALASSLFWVIRQQQGPSPALRGWLLLFVGPLLFVFAYPRFLFASSAQTDRTRSAAILHGLAAAITTILFVIWGSPFWRNPIRDADSILLLAVPFVAVPVFFVAAISLLLKNRSTLAKFASFIFWPYWLLLALLFVGRWFEATPFRTAFCFLCFVSPILFAFAAGAISHRPTIAHRSALAGLVGMPWIYWTTLKDSSLGNIWTAFNVPDQELRRYNDLPAAELSIACIALIALIALAIATAVLRLLPVRWSLRRLPLCERTWPAFLTSFLFLAIWFSQSVMPYRINGAVDYGVIAPILKILHVEKRGLQFHELCVTVSGYRNRLESVSFSGNDRRLFQYRFQEKVDDASGKLPEVIKARIQSMMQSSEKVTQNADTVKPLREWNDDGWYLGIEGVGLKTYATHKGTTPPQEIVDLFDDLQKLPRTREVRSDMKDVCLGFCYDPLSGLGVLHANQRCRYDGHAYVCR